MLASVTPANTPGRRYLVIFGQGASRNRSQSMSAMHSARREGGGHMRVSMRKILSQTTMMVQARLLSLLVT